MARLYGIDFGTSNSAVVSYDSRLNRFVDIGENGAPIPSVVAVDHFNQEVTVGRGVRDQMAHLMQGGRHLIVESVKTMLDQDTVWETPGRRWTAETIAAELFRALSARAEAVTGEPIRRAVVAIPIGMTAAQRATLRLAARRAGIEVAAFVTEPTAAFISHVADLRNSRFAVVFDWGGGTLDISVLEVRSGSIIERHTEGAHQAGDYIDRKLAEWAHARIAERHGLNLEFDNVAPNERQALCHEAERCKRRLNEEKITQETITLGRYAGLRLVEQAISREVLDDLVSPVVDDALDLLEDCVREARIAGQEIGRLIVVGGSSKLRLLRRELPRRWPQPNILFPAGADWDIARGAARLAARPGCYRLAEGLGVILADGEYHPIFPGGSQLKDAVFNLHFGLVEDAQTANFNFATEDRDSRRAKHIGNMLVPVLGFRDEIIELNCRITQDLVFHATAASQRKPGDHEPYTYDRVRWMYEIPAEG